MTKCLQNMSKRNNQGHSYSLARHSYLDKQEQNFNHGKSHSIWKLEKCSFLAPITLMFGYYFYIVIIFHYTFIDLEVAEIRLVVVCNEKYSCATRHSKLPHCWESDWFPIMEHSSKILYSSCIMLGKVDLLITLNMCCTFSLNKTAFVHY